MIRSLTFLPRFVGDRIRNGWRAAKIEAQRGSTFAGLENIRHVECPLPELVVRRADKLSAELDGRERVQSIENEPGACGVVESESVSAS